MIAAAAPLCGPLTGANNPMVTNYSCRIRGRRAGVGGGDGVLTGLDLDRAVAAAVLTNLRMDQPVWCSIQQLTAQGGEDVSQLRLPAA
jgi:hypothetical protein